MNCDQQMREEFKENPQCVIGYMLMASYLYYHKEGMEPILSDIVFDKACKWLYDNYNSVEHKFKDIIEREALQAGSLFAVPLWKYDNQLKRIAILLSEGDGSFLNYSDSSSSSV